MLLKIHTLLKFLILIIVFSGLTNITLKQANAISQPNTSIRLGILPISSQYNDEGVNKKEETPQSNSLFNSKGSMLLFTYQTKPEGTRLFGITSSHVSQGRNFSIDGKIIDSQTLIGRLAQNDDDLEILEFANNSMESMAEWDQESSLIILNADKLKKWIEANKKIQNPFVKMTKEDGSFLNNFVLKGDWINSTPQNFSQSYSHQSQYNFGTNQSNFGDLTYLPIENEIYALASLSPGISGSPLISIVKPKLLSKIKNNSFFSHINFSIDQLFSNFNFSVIGISKSAARNLPGSWFATAPSVAHLFKSYLEGTRGTLGETRWHLRNGLTYRNFGNGASEIFPTTYKVGNLTRGDGGNLIRGDSSQIEITSPFDLETWMSFQITPGIKYNNKPILGFRIFNDIGFYVEGNPNKVLEYFKPSILDRFNMRFNGKISTLIKEIPLHSNFIALLTDKFKGYIHQVRREDETNLKKFHKGEIPLNKSQFTALLNDDFTEPNNSKIDTISPISSSNNSNISQQILTILKNRDRSYDDDEKKQYINYWQTVLQRKIDVTHPKIDKLLDQHTDSNFNITLSSSTSNESIDTSQSNITIKNNLIHFHIKGPKPEEETMSFVLDYYGRIVDQASLANTTDFFIPLLKIKSNLGKNFTVDLRSLFFVDTSRYIAKSINPSFIQVDEKFKLEQLDLLYALMEGVVLRFRSEATQQIYEIQFNDIRSNMN